MLKIFSGRPPDPPSERGFNPLSHSPPTTPLALPRRLRRLISSLFMVAPPPFQNPGPTPVFSPHLILCAVSFKPLKSCHKMLNLVSTPAVSKHSQFAFFANQASVFASEMSAAWPNLSFGQLGFASGSSSFASEKTKIWTPLPHPC